MIEVLKIIIGILVLILGIFIGNFLALKTKEELKAGQKWFRLIIICSFIAAIISLIIGNDILLFAFLFISVVTSRSLIIGKKIRKSKKR